MTAFTVITVGFGKNSGLDRTVASVAAQDHLPVKHLLVLRNVPDDEIVALPPASYRQVIRDQDQSLYNAMNIGLDHAVGDLVVFLNSGDQFYGPRTLAIVARKWDGSSIVAGRSLQTCGNDLYLRPRIGHLDALYTSSPHQAFYAPLRATLPRYREAGQIGADSRWMNEVRAMVGQQCIADLLCKFELGGLSNSPTWKTVQRRHTYDGLVPAIKEASKLVVHRLLGAQSAYRFLYRNKYARCDAARANFQGAVR